MIKVVHIHEAIKYASIRSVVLRKPQVSRLLPGITVLRMTSSPCAVINRPSLVQPYYATFQQQPKASPIYMQPCPLQRHVHVEQYYSHTVQI